MPITEAQREARKDHVGGSDVAAILGVNPFGQTAWDVWADKTRRLEPEPPSPAMLAGNALEPSICDWAEEKLGPVFRNQYRSSPALHLGVNLDGIAQGTHEPVEAKTAGLFFKAGDEWGEDGTGEVPVHVIIQCHAQMIVMKGEPQVCHVPALLGGRGFQLFHVERNKDLCDIIGERVFDFWENFVLKDTPPIGTVGSLPILKRVIRYPNKIVPVSPTLIARRERIHRRLDRAKERAEQIASEILTQMEDAEGGDYGDPEKIMTYFKQTRKEHVVMKSTFRVLRNQKRPKEK